MIIRLIRLLKVITGDSKVISLRTNELIPEKVYLYPKSTTLENPKYISIHLISYQKEGVIKLQVASERSHYIFIKRIRVKKVNNILALL